MTRTRMIWLCLLAAAAACASLVVPLSSNAKSARSKRHGSSHPPGMVVRGNRLLTGRGKRLRVAGVNRSGTEFACVEGWGIFDGPSSKSSIAAMKRWGINAVRVPLNEDCWLGINGVKRQYGGRRYRRTIYGFVQRLRSEGLDVILDLHWSAPGDGHATGQAIAPDASHSPRFWHSVAHEFRHLSGMAYDLFNEPNHISWRCWLRGCMTYQHWRATGMQQLINAIRRAGSRQPVIAEGLHWGADLTQWLSHRPRDPAHQLVAGWHVYNFTACNTVRCWNRTIAPVARKVPILATEIGESDCAGGFIDKLLPWADRHHIGYLAWAWNAWSCEGGPGLITSYNGTPTAYGAAYRNYLRRTRR